MKTTRALGALASAVLATSLAACASTTTGGGGDGGGDDGRSLIVVTPTPVGANNFLGLAVDGAQAVGEQEDADVRVFESKDPASIQQNVDSAVRESPDVVIGVSFQVQEQVEAAAADNPDQQFLLVDACPEEPADNLTCATFKEYEATYLTGVAAGLLTQEDSVGVVAALDTPFIHRWIDPFYAGAESVNPGVATAVQYVGGDNAFGDPARAKARGLVLGDAGADYVQAAASGGNTGVFEAGSEGGFQVFGVDTNQCPDSPGNVVDNAIKRVDVALSEAVKEILAGNGGGVKVYGLAEDGVGLTSLEDGVEDSGCTIADHPDVIEKVREVRDQIVDGTITVEDPLTAG